MEIVILRYKSLAQALLTLTEGLAELETVSSKAKEYSLMRDGVIQRFEYSIDSFWKFIKIYLEMIQKVSVEASSPRAILKLALASRLIDEAEYDILLDSVADRNMTSHTYNEEMAEKIQMHIPKYYMTMKAVIERVRPNLS